MMRWIVWLLSGWRIPRYEDDEWRHVPPPIHRARRGGVEYW